MASPQVENGYTRIANELLDKLAETKINGTQFRILMVVFRYTYGFQRKKHELSETFIAKATNIHRQQIKRELKDLIDRKIITVVKQATFTNPRVISFNKNYEQWKSIQATKKIPHSQIDTSTGSEKATPTGSEKATQEKKIFKENIKESSSSIDNLQPLMNDENLKRIAKAYKDNGFGILFPNAGQALLELADEYTIEWVELAMEKAGKMGKRNVAYVEGILKGWEREGQPSMEIRGRREQSQPSYFKPLEYEFED